jgi:hypothetical protein
MFVATPDTPMAEAEILRAEELLGRREITQSDMAWLLGFEDSEEDRPPPRGFKSWQHFNAFKWHMEQKRLGRKVPRKRKRRAA